MPNATDKISLCAMDCHDHVEAWQEYHEEGLVVRLMMTEAEVEEAIKVYQAILIEMVNLRTEKGYPK
jgi:hypothetical protein